MIRRSLFSLATLLTVAVATPASAQWGGNNWGNNDPQPQQRSADVDQASRISRMENQLRQLNGQIEQLQNQIKRLEDAQRRQQQDTEFRFQELQQGGGAAAPTRPAKRSDAAPPTEQRTMPMPGTTEDGRTYAAPRTSAANSNMGTAPAPLGQLPADQSGQPMDLTQGRGAAVHSGAQYAAPAAAAGGAVAAPSSEAKDEYDLAYGYILRGDHELAEVSFRQFLANHPSDKNAGNALYWLGESHYQRRQYRPAAEAFLKSYNEYPKGNKAPESLLRLGMSLKQLGEKEKACQTYAAVLVKYPRASNAVKQRVQTEQKNAGC